MAEVKLYIYQDENHKDNCFQLSTETEYSYDKNTILPPKITTAANNNRNVEQTSVLTSYKISTTLSSVEYWKRVYDHSEIKAQLQVTSIQKKTTQTVSKYTVDSVGKVLDTPINNTTEGKYSTTAVRGAVITKFFRGAKVIMTIDGKTVAENFVVFNVRIHYKTVSSTTSQYVELGIFSADKLMDLDKYSRAYTARMLYTDILKKESDEKFSSVQVANQMQLLKTKGTESETNNNVKTTYEWTEREELRIPYIVQYNETFYRFMVRSANRYGEFLYFEDGKLNLGMQPLDPQYYQTDDDGKVVQENGMNIPIDWAAETTAVQELYYDSMITEGIAVEDFAYNYIDHKNNDDDTVGKLYADSSSNRYNPDPVATDEWTTQLLKEGEYLDLGEVMGEEMKAFIPEAVFKALESGTFSEALINLVKGVVMKVIEVSKSTNDFNNVMDEANYQNDDLEYLIFSDQRSGDEYTQFTTFGGSDNLEKNMSSLFGKDGINNFIDLFYPIIRKQEKDTSDQAVWLDFGSNYKHFKLGDKIVVENTEYVIVYVEGSYKDSTEHLLVQALPVMVLDVSSPAETSSGKEAWSGVVPIPPALPDVVIREAKPQVAFVAETLDPQNLGRIRVRYPWQNSKDDASPWIRITLPLATKGGAVNFTPQVGDEVMVGYVNGNIDHPYGMGYLAAPFVNKKWSNALPLDQYGGVHGIKTKTGHHLTFEDGFDIAPMLFDTIGGLAFIRSLWPTGLTGTWPYGNETTADFGGGFELSDRYGFYKIAGSTDSRSVTIESPAGMVEVNAFQGITISAPNGEVNITGKNVNISANNRLTLTSGENIKDKLAYQKKWSEHKGKALGMAALTDLKGARDSVAEIATNFTDLSFWRCVLEWLLHPVNGTLQIKSYTFVTVEAGEGKAEVPPKSLRKVAIPDFYKEYKAIELIKMNVYALFDNLRIRYNELVAATQAFNRISGTAGINKNETAISYTEVITSNDDLTEDKFKWEDGTGNDLAEEVDNFTDVKPKESDYKYKTQYNRKCKEWSTKKRKYYKDLKKRNTRRLSNRGEIMSISISLQKAAKDLSDAAKKWTDMTDGDFVTLNLDKKVLNVSDLVKTIKAEGLISNGGIKSLSDLKDKKYDKTIAKPDDDAWTEQKKALTRYLIYKYIKEIDDLEYDKDAVNSKDDVKNNDKWRKFVGSLKKKDGLGVEVKAGLIDWAWEDLNPLAGFVNDHFQWNLGFKGQILMSDQSGKTASFDPEQNLVSHDNQAEDCVDLITDMLKTI